MKRFRESASANAAIHPGGVMRQPSPLKSVSRPRSPGTFAVNWNPANPARSSATENIRRNSGRESNSAATAAPRCRMEAVAKTANTSATSIAHAAGAPGIRATANAMAIIGG